MNKWIGIGRLTRDGELRFTAGKGTANLTFTLAVDDGFGENKKTYFIPIVVWGKSAESLASYLVKGTQAAVSGKIVPRNYENNEGRKIYVTEVVADNFDGIKLLNKGQGAQGNQYSSQGNDSFGQGNFEEDITPVEDGEMPF